MYIKVLIRVFQSGVHKANDHVTIVGLSDHLKRLLICNIKLCLLLQVYSVLSRFIEALPCVQ